MQYQIFKSFGTSVSESKSESSGLFEEPSNISELNLVLLDFVVPFLQNPNMERRSKVPVPTKFRTFQNQRALTVQNFEQYPTLK